MNTRVNKLVKISLLSAMACTLMYIEFPILPMFPWLKMDLGDVPALLGGFALGPLSGIIIELLKNLLKLLIKGTMTGCVGEFANFLVGISLIVPASLLYHKNKNKKSVILGMLLGGISMEVIGVLTNIYILLPAYGMHMSTTESVKYITIGLLPFNGLKAFLVSVLGYVLYQKVLTKVLNNSASSDSNINQGN